MSIATAGYLITAFAVAMAVGGPIMAMVIVRLPPRAALLMLLLVSSVGNLLAAIAPNYTVMLLARVITGMAAQAFWGTAISLAAVLASAEVRTRAIAVVLNGLMLGTLLGLPLSTVVGNQLGWRAAFVAMAGLAALAAVTTIVGIPTVSRLASPGGARQEFAVFRRPRLWLAMTTSMLVIGATFAAFSYVAPILTQATGFSGSTVPLLLVAYGAATLVGNNIVGRLADRHTTLVLLSGLALNAVFLTGFALLAGLAVPAVLCFLGIGLVGVTMNSALVTRVQRAGNARPLVNTIHSSFITTGIIIGSSVGGVAIGTFGLRGPLWLGAGLAALGVLTVLPDLLLRRVAALAPVPA